MKNKIIDDLLLQYPKGPKYNMVKYTTEQKWCNKKEKNITKKTPDLENWGYTDDEIFNLNLHGIIETQRYLSKYLYDSETKYTLPGPKKRWVTIKSQRLWRRLRDSVYRVKSSGGVGIYEIRLGYSDIIGHLYASSQEEAETLASCFCGHLSEAWRTIKVSFVRMGNASLIEEMNIDTTVKLEKEIDSLQKTISSLTINRERSISILNTLRTVESGQLNILSKDKLS